MKITLSCQADIRNPYSLLAHNRIVTIVDSQEKGGPFMTYSEAKELQRQVEKKRECNHLLEKLCQQQKELAPKVSELEKRSRKEQSDVNKLESISLSSIFYGLIGKKEEKLNKERQEAREAKLKYESAARELAYIEDEIRKIQEELSQITDCEQEFYAYLKEEYEILRATKNLRFHEIADIEQQIGKLENKVSKVQAAVKLGKELGYEIDNMLLILEQAEKKNGIYTQMEMAEGELPNLQNKMGAFREKLEELDIHTEIEVDEKAFTNVLGAPLYGMTYDNLEISSQIWSRVVVLLRDFRPIKGQVAELMQQLSVLETDAKQELICAKKSLEDKIIELVSL